MTRAELKTIYVEAAIRARAKPQRSEEDVWFKEFEYADMRDLRAAIDAHFKHSEWMPKESILKPLVEQSRHSRLARSSENRLLARWRCPDCKATCCDFVAPDDHRTRRCNGIPQRQHYGESDICGAALTEVHRGQYQSERRRAA